MPLPAALLQVVEQHPCFSGCYASQDDTSVCLDPLAAPVSVLSAHCDDCLLFKVGALRSLLPAGMTTYNLARELTQHMMLVRGFDLATGGYHTAGGGFWLSAVYSAKSNVFLVDGHRSTAKGTEIDLLVRAFQHKVLTPPDAGMLDPNNYQPQRVFVNMAGFQGGITNAQAFLQSPHCSASARSGFHEVVLATWQNATQTLPAPVVTGAHAARPAPPKRATAPKRPQRPGDICPDCGAEVRERPLFTGSYVGCLCG